MPGPPFAHGCKYDVFVSYTHADNDIDPAGWRWVAKFTHDLHTRLKSVSGREITFWRDEERLGAADRFDDSIQAAINQSAILLVVLSPGYFNSAECRKERDAFYRAIAAAGRTSAGGKARVLKVAKFHVPLESYPQDLKSLLEHRFYDPGPPPKEFHLSADPLGDRRYGSKVDDVAQELAGLLAALEPAASPPERSGIVYLAESTSDVEPQRVMLRRQLTQLGVEVQPAQELRLLPPVELRSAIAGMIERAQLVVHPVGGYYGVAPEGTDGKSLVEIQLEVSQADARNGGLGRIIWLPDDLTVQEPRQQDFIERIRTSMAGRGFDLVERPYRALETRVTDRLRRRSPVAESPSQPPRGVYLICDKDDRALAKSVRSFISSQHWDVEWTPIGIEDLTTSADHQRLLARNQGHLVFHGRTSETWIQDRVRELNAARRSGTPPVQAIYLSDPERPDKDDILAPDVDVLRGYAPTAIGAGLEPFLRSLGGSRP